MIQLNQIKDKRVFKKKVNFFLRNSPTIGLDAVLLIEYLRNHSNIFLIGGVIRNLANNEPVRDIDMIYTNINALELIKNKSDYTSNRLGGTKIKLKKINVDLWPLAENWATKKGLIDTKYALTKELAKGTFFNFDSLVYSINSNVLKCELYNECLKKKELDIIIHDSRY